MYRFYVFFISLLLSGNHIYSQNEAAISPHIHFSTDTTLRITFKNNSPKPFVIWLQDWRVAAFERTQMIGGYPHWNTNKNEIYVYKQEVKLGQMIAYGGDRFRNSSPSMYPNSMKILKEGEQFCLNILVSEFDSKGILTEKESLITYLYSIAPLSRIERLIRPEKYPDIFSQSDSLAFFLPGDPKLNSLFSQRQNYYRDTSTVELESSKVFLLESCFEVNRYDIP